MLLPLRFCQRCDVRWSHNAGWTCWVCGHRGAQFAERPRTVDEHADTLIEQLCRSDGQLSNSESNTLFNDRARSSDT